MAGAREGGHLALALRGIVERLARERTEAAATRKSEG
jgi:hypothetical protein